MRWESEEQKIKWLDQEGLGNETIKIKGERGGEINKIVRLAGKGEKKE